MEQSKQMPMNEVISSLLDLRQQLDEVIRIAKSENQSCITKSILQPIDRCKAHVEDIYQKVWRNKTLSSSGEPEEPEPGIFEVEIVRDPHDSQLSEQSKEDNSNQGDSSQGKEDISETGDEDFGDVDIDDFLASPSKVSASSFKVDREEEVEAKDENFYDDDDDDDLLLNCSNPDEEDLTDEIPDTFLGAGETSEGVSPPDSHLEVDSEENSLFQQPDKSYLDVLKRNFGHSEFRHHQWGIIDSVLNAKRDSCVIMSTGYGKSLTFQFPSVFTGRTSVVVSPLISLMEDQVRALQASGIKSCFLGSAQKDSRAMEEAMIDGRFRLVYVTPEFLTGDRAMPLLKRLDRDVGIDLFAVDESHCVSQWGVDFRESYRRLGCIKENFPSTPVLAVTATATSRVQKDICSILKLRNPKLVCTSFDRPNLFLSVEKKMGDARMDLKPLLHRDGRRYAFEGPTIIYCPRRVDTNSVAAVLSDLKVPSMAYHAGLSHKARQEAHHSFLNDEIQVIVATVAFGMGIDKPDVRQVIHYGAPKDIESYYQEIGRAGRDGMPSTCKVLYDEKDFRTSLFMLNQMANENFKKHKFDMFQKMKRYLNAQECRRRLLLSYFERGSVDDIGGTAKCCDVCRARILCERNGHPANSLKGVATQLVDYGKEALDLMKAIQVCGGRYGLEVPALILTGSVSNRVDRFKESSVFGKGRYRPKKFWTVLGKRLIEEDFLKNEMIQGGFGCSVDLSPKAFKFLTKARNDATHPQLMMNPGTELANEDKSLSRSAVSISFKSPSPIVKSTFAYTPSVSKEVNPPAVSRVSPPKETPVDPKIQAMQTKLYAILLTVRRSLADETGFTPHSIASNKVLLDMAKYRPSTMESLTRLEDYPEAKARKFGPGFLTRIVDFCKDNQLDMDDFPKASTSSIADSDEVNDRLKELLMSLNASQRMSYIIFGIRKLSLEETAVRQGLKTSTILGHMCEAIKAGLEVDTERLGLSPDREQLIRRTILSYPVNGAITSLTRIKDCLPESVEYNHIRVVVAKLVGQFGRTINEHGEGVINTDIVNTDVVNTDVVKAEYLEADGSGKETSPRATTTLNKRLSSPSAPDSHRPPPSKMIKSSAGSFIVGDSVPAANAKTDLSASQGSQPALRKTNSQASGRALPAWMQASQNKAVFKKKMKANSLFK